MSLRFLTGHRRFASQGFLLIIFCAAFAALTLFVIFRPAGEVEGRPALQQAVPHASLDRSFTPSSVDEGQNFAVKVKLDRPLGDNMSMDNDRAVCYGSGGATETPCIEGGIIVWDSYNNAEGDRGLPTS